MGGGREVGGWWEDGEPKVGGRWEGGGRVVGGRWVGLGGLPSSFTCRVRPCLELKQRTPLSSGVATGISWSALSGLKEVKPPVEF